MYNLKYGFAPYFYTEIQRKCGNTAYIRRIYFISYLSISDTENTVRRYASPPPLYYKAYILYHIIPIFILIWFWSTLNMIEGRTLHAA